MATFFPVNQQICEIFILLITCDLLLITYHLLILSLCLRGLISIHQQSRDCH